MAIPAIPPTITPIPISHSWENTREFVTITIPTSMMITNDNEKIMIFFANNFRSFLEFSFCSQQIPFL